MKINETDIINAAHKALSDITGNRPTITIKDVYRTANLGTRNAQTSQTVKNTLLKNGFIEVSSQTRPHRYTLASDSASAAHR